MRATSDKYRDRNYRILRSHSEKLKTKAERDEKGKKRNDIAGTRVELHRKELHSNRRGKGPKETGAACREVCGDPRRIGCGHRQCEGCLTSPHPSRVASPHLTDLDGLQLSVTTAAAAAWNRLRRQIIERAMHRGGIRRPFEGRCTKTHLPLGRLNLSRKSPSRTFVQK